MQKIYIFSYLLSAHVDKIVVSGGNIDPGLEAVHKIQNISVAMTFEDLRVFKIVNLPQSSVIVRYRVFNEDYPI